MNTEFKKYLKKLYFSNRYLYCSNPIELGKVNGLFNISEFVLKEERITHIKGNTEMMIINPKKRYIKILLNHDFVFKLSFIFLLFNLFILLSVNTSIHLECFIHQQ